MDVNIILFHDFETLDVFGPVEVFGSMRMEYNIRYFSTDGGIICSRQGTQIITEPMEDIKKGGILMIPGGQGTRKLVDDSNFLSKVAQLVNESTYCITICTGSAILAKTNLLDYKRATSNKFAFSWVQSLNDKVIWEKKARWVVDDKFYTSSGVSAGIDMALGFIEDRFGKEQAVEIANHMEYVWNQYKEDDIFTMDDSLRN